MKENIEEEGSSALSTCVPGEKIHAKARVMKITGLVG